MTTKAIAAAVAAKCANVATIRAASPTDVDVIPSSPYAIVGAHTGTVQAGNWEKLEYTFPIKVFVERTADDARTAAAVNDLLDAFIAEFRSGVQLGNTVAQSVIASWNTQGAATSGTADYWVLEMTLEVTVAQGRSYSA